MVFYKSSDPTILRYIKPNSKLKDLKKLILETNDLLDEKNLDNLDLIKIVDKVNEMRKLNFKEEFPIEFLEHLNKINNITDDNIYNKSSNNVNYKDNDDVGAIFKNVENRLKLSEKKLAAGRKKCKEVVEKLEKLDFF